MARLSRMIAVAVFSSFLASGTAVCRELAKVSNLFETQMKFTLDLAGTAGSLTKGKKYHFTEKDVTHVDVYWEDRTLDGQPDFLQLIFELTPAASQIIGDPRGIEIQISTDRLQQNLAAGTFKGTGGAGIGGTEVGGGPAGTAGLSLDIGGGACSTRETGGSFTVSNIAFDCKTPASGGSSYTHLSALGLTFTHVCTVAANVIETGSLTFTDDSGGASGCSTGGGTPGGGGGGGGTGGGGGGGSTPTPPPPPKNVSFAFPASVAEQPVAMTPQATTSFDFSTAVVSGFSSDVTLSAVSDANDSEFFDVSVSPATIPAPGAGNATVMITTHPLTFPRDYNVTLIATTSDGTNYYGSFVVSVLCDPPKILGTQQPKSATITGSAATLTVTSAGSPPFTYQWYSGMPGMDMFPVKDATGATLTTGEDGMYWVRVSNACGSADSQAATVSKQ